MTRIFSSSPIYPQQGLALVRIITGFFLVYHGWEIFNTETMNSYLVWDQFKNPSGKVLIYAGKASELIAGIMLLLGLFTRIGAILAAGTLAYIAFFVGQGKVWYEDQHPFLFVLLALVFFFAGPGAWSMDGIIFKKAQ
jgi:putative oxidoreductase